MHRLPVRVFTVADRVNFYELAINIVYYPIVPYSETKAVEWHFKFFNI